MPLKICYGYPYGSQGSAVFEWMFIHSGQYPLTDVSVRIHNLATVPGQAGFVVRTLNIGTAFPGKAQMSGAQDARLSSHGYNLFFLARNGGWTQEIRWADMPGVLTVANRVVRDGMPLDKPLLLNVSPEFPGRVPVNAWNDPPPYTAKSPGSS
jgi:hypothetical protein